MPCRPNHYDGLRNRSPLESAEVTSVLIIKRLGVDTHTHDNPSPLPPATTTLPSSPPPHPPKKKTAIPHEPQHEVITNHYKLRAEGAKRSRRREKTKTKNYSAGNSTNLNAIGISGVSSPALSWVASRVVSRGTCPGPPGH